MSDTTGSVTAPGEILTRIPMREWTVEVVAGPDKGQRFTTLGGLVRVGSDGSNDLVLTDSTVSRRHIELERTSRGLLLRDVGSRNGTLLDDHVVLQAIVEPGDRIHLGKTRLSIRIREDDTEIEVLGGESFGALVGASDAMRIVFAELRRMAKDESTLLLEGETGTGKELAARAVHAYSARRAGPFRVVDCPMLTAENAERDLFGPEGAFVNAKGGTLFFDEVSELPLAVQPKLLRVLETKEIPAMGAQPARKLEARIIAATLTNLAEEVQQGHFRQDLLYRIAVVRIRLPPLRTHKSDLPLLARHLVRTLAAPLELSSQMLAMLEGYDWPGNVRELRNVLERGALLHSTGNGTWLDFMETTEKPGRHSLRDLVASLPYHDAKDRIVADFERAYFAEVMKNTGFDFKVAQQRTGLSMQSLYRLLKKNGLRIKDLKNAEGLT